MTGLSGSHETGRRLIEAGKYAEAIDPLLEAERAHPGDAAILNDLGVAYMASRRFREAAEALRRSVASQANVGSTHYNLGLALQHVGDEDGAIVEHRRAVALSPELAGAHAQLGDLLLERGRRDEAIRAYEQAHAAAPHTPFGHLGLAKALLADGDHARAETELRSVIASEPTNGSAHTLLGRVLQEVGRFEDAAASFERSIALNPWHANGYYGVVSSKRLTEGDRPWLAQMRARLDASEWTQAFSPAVAQRHRMMLHFAAGKALDDLGDYDDAMRHFHAANAIRQRLSPFHREGTEQLVDQILARFTPDLFETSSHAGRGDEAPMLVVGMPRSGTTLLERILASHSQVRGRGELSFWIEHGPRWMAATSEAREGMAGTLRADYLRLLLRGGAGALKAVDKMPFNFLWAGLVHLLFPNARIVHSRRDPIDTCLSIYATPFTASWGFGSKMSDLAWYYRLYVRVMDHWRRVLPPDRLLDVDYEDVVAYPEATSRKLVAFAGLDWEPACLRPENNRDIVTTASSWQARQPIYASSAGRRRHYARWLDELRGLPGADVTFTAR